MGITTKTIFVEMRASADKLKADLVAVNNSLAVVGSVGKDAGAKVSTGMTVAHESIGKVAKTAGEAALAVETVMLAMAKYSGIAAASAGNTETLVNSYRALRVALDPSLFTASSIAVGILAQKTIELTLARARLIEQQSLIAAKGGISISSVERSDATAGISGGSANTIRSLQAALQSRLASNAGGVGAGLNMLGVAGSSTDPDLLEKIAKGFESIQDPAQRAAAAVAIFGAADAGVALDQLNSRFVSASEAVTKYGLVLDSVSRTQIYQFRKEFIDLKNAVTDFSELKGWWASFQQGTEIVAAAAEDMARRGEHSLAGLIEKYGPGMQALRGLMHGQQSLSASELMQTPASRRKDDVTARMQGDDLFAQSQLAHFRQSQTVEGQQGLQSAAQSRADSAYSQLSDDAAKRKANPNDTSLLPGDQVRSLAIQQQSAQALANAYGESVKKLQDAAAAQEKVKAAAERLAEFQAGAGDRLNTLYQSATTQSIKDPVARQMFQGRIEIGKDADQTTDSEKSGRAQIVTGQIRGAANAEILANANVYLAAQTKLASDQLSAFGKALQKRTDDYAKSAEKAQRSDNAAIEVGEIQAKGAGVQNDLNIQRQKLELERSYGLEIGHTGQEQISYMSQVASLNDKANTAKLTGLAAEIQLAEAEANAAKGTDKEVESAKKLAELLQEIAKLSGEAQNSNFAAITAIQEKQKSQSLGGRLDSDFQGIKQQIPGQLGGALAKGIIDGKKIGDDIRQSLRGIGQEMMGSVFKELIATVIGNTAATGTLSFSTIAQTIATDAQTVATWAVTAAQYISSFFADGTDSAPGGRAWVGERGPEIVNLPRGSQVIPNNRLGAPGLSRYPNLPSARGFSGAGPTPSSSSSGGHTFHNTFHIYDASDPQEVARTMADYLQLAVANTTKFSR